MAAGDLVFCTSDVGGRPVWLLEYALVRKRRGPRALAVVFSADLPLGNTLAELLWLAAQVPTPDLPGPISAGTRAGLHGLAQDRMFNPSYPGFAVGRLGPESVGAVVSTVEYMRRFRESGSIAPSPMTDDLEDIEYTGRVSDLMRVAYLHDTALVFRVGALAVESVEILGVESGSLVVG